MDKVSKVFDRLHRLWVSIRVKVLVDARAVEFSKVHAKIKDVKDFKVAQAVEFSKVHVWELHIQDKAVKECHVFQVKV